MRRPEARAHRLHAAFIAAATAMACAPTPSQTREPSAAGPTAAPEGPAQSPDAPEGQATAPWLDWQHGGPTSGASHPLVGKIFDVRSATFVSPEDLLRHAQSKDYLLLGETHDNADHHRLQAWVVANAGAEHPALVFEMITSAQQNLLDPFLADPSSPASPAERAAGLATTIDWAESGWPAFDLYAPIFEAAFEQSSAGPNISLRGAGLVRESFAPLMRGEPLSPSARIEAGIESELSPELRSQWLKEMTAAHCNAMPIEAMGPMVTAQRMRDARMARELVAFPKAILIAGAGHTRPDRGVPAYLPSGVDDVRTLSLAFVEVDAASTAASDYPSHGHDFVWFTPAAQRVDPCAAFSQHAKPASDDAKPASDDAKPASDDAKPASDDAKEGEAP